MPELKHHFRAGKMNKDLDERLVPNGEYRDAQNIEISVSEGSDVGSVQNVRGNTKITGKAYNENSKSITANWGSGFGLTNAKCIGHVLNNETDKIYWFITSNESDCIAEYDDVRGIVRPVLVDANNILNFTASQYITGINIIEGLLFWTDDTTEPKKIDIEIFKSGCSDNFTTHSKYTGEKILPSNLSSAAAFTEEHITVAKQAPITAPTLVMSNSTRGGNGTGTNTVLITNSTAGLFANSDNEGIAVGSSVSLTLSPQANFEVGDIISVTATYEDQDSQENYEIKIKLTSVTNSGASVVGTIQSIPVDVAYVALPWEALLSEDAEVLFEKKMVRFGYRWKYTSGEYSVFSPFSVLAFNPTTFEYLSSDGHNVGMINNLRDLTITIPSTTPLDVEEIDILYKESNNQLVYVVDSLKRDSYNNFDFSYKLESELIGQVVESNQMLRPWDNVPRVAKAQEITANRLIFANYKQNYDVPKYNLPEINLTSSSTNITTVKEPELSVKSLRTYQAGVVYLDKYNRQTPVFTSKKASTSIPKSFANKVNSLSLVASNEPPSWATHFKHYIKETSNEYYNLAMDRYYLAEDGNVWLSFPSSERNKIAEDSYLILKKRHDSDTPVEIKARYKVLDISNEAPDFIKLKKKANAKVGGLVHSTGIPQIGSTTFKFKSVDPLDNATFAQSFTSDNLIQIVVGGAKTEKYQIVSGGYTGETDGSGASSHIYSVTIGEPLREGESMLNGLADGDAIDITMYEEKFERQPEHYGRFFAKINRNGAFDTNIIESYVEEEQQWGISNSRTITANAVNLGAGSSTNGESWYDTQDRNSSRYITQANNGHPKSGSKTMRVYRAGAPGRSSPNRKEHDKSHTVNAFLKSLSTGGTYFRFKNGDGDTGEIYEVTGCTINYQLRRTSGKRYYSAKRREYNITFEHWINKTGYQDSFSLPSSGSHGTNFINQIQILEKVIDQDNEQLTSNNPAIWETEPKEAVDLDLYYETGDTLPISQYNNTHTLLFKNCYSFGNGVESDRLRDDFNAVKIDKGVKVSTVLAEQYNEEHRKNGLIYSGIFNSTSGINRLNQFIQGEAITKDVNPHYGSIQKLHARNTDLIAFCEDKILKILANKDALFEANGNTQLTATNRVLGQAIPYIGNYGISKNPESFASYAFRVYFTDKNRGSVLRLSRDGLTAISENGMRDYFKDNLPATKLMLGTYDGSKGLYNLTLDSVTVSFDEKVNGWPSFKSFIPEAACALNNKYFSIKNGELWVHTNEVRNTFYGGSYNDSSVTLLINDAAETIKGYKTLNYSGSRSKIYTNDYDASNNYSSPTSTNTPGWHCEYINTDQQEGFVKEFIKKENRYYNNIKGIATTLDNLDSQEFSVQGIGNFTGNLTGDTTTVDKNLNVNLTGIANTTNSGITFPVQVSTEIHSTRTSANITIVPNTGSTIDAAALSVTNATLSSISQVSSVTFAQSGVNVIATVNFTDGVNMPTNDLTINIAVVGDGALNVYKLNDLTLSTNTDSSITVTKTYLGSSTATANIDSTHTGFPATYDGTTFESVATVEFLLASAKDFKEVPQFKILTEDNLPESAYEITFQDFNSSNAAVTIGVSGVTLPAVQKRIFTIKYRFPAQDTSKNEIQFNANSVDSAAIEVNKINGYRFSGASIVDRFAQTKELYIFGAVGATFSLKQVIDSGSNEYYNNGNWDSSVRTLEIPSSGMFTATLSFVETSVTKSYTYTIAAIAPTTLLSPIVGNIYNASNVAQNPFVIYQYADATLTLGATTTGGFTITSSNSTMTAPANSFPFEKSTSAQSTLTITATATNNITENRDVETVDFTNYNSNGFVWEYDKTSVIINNGSSPKTLTLVGTVTVDQYGTTDTTSTVNINNMFTVAGGSGVLSLLLQPQTTGSQGGIIICFNTYNDGTFSQVGSKTLLVGTANNTNISGTGTIYGNFYGNTLQQITLSISPGTGTSTNTSCFDNMTVTKQSIVGSSTSSDLHFNWTAQLNETITASSVPIFNVNVALANEP